MVRGLRPLDVARSAEALLQGANSLSVQERRLVASASLATQLRRHDSNEPSRKDKLPLYT